ILISDTNKGACNIFLGANTLNVGVSGSSSTIMQGTTITGVKGSGTQPSGTLTVTAGTITLPGLADAAIQVTLDGATMVVSGVGKASLVVGANVAMVNNAVITNNGTTTFAQDLTVSAKGANGGSFYNLLGNVVVGLPEVSDSVTMSVPFY